MCDQTEMRRASAVDIPIIRGMADIVFRETYAGILSPAQMEYMMDWMYSAASLEDQILPDGKAFYIAERGGLPCGYVSFEYERRMEDGRNLYHLQKLYVLPEYQHAGVGSAMLDFVFRHLSSLHPEGCRVELNVNRHNPAVGFYEKMGLTCDRQGDFAIGEGFYMNDYIYARDL